MKGMIVAYSAWALLVDIGLISALLLLGALLRASLRPLQNLLIPASIIGGLLGFLVSPQVLGSLDWRLGSFEIGGLPFSSQLSTYTSILIAVVFACMAIADDFKISGMGRSLTAFSAYGVMMSAGQVLVGVTLVLCLLRPLLDTPIEMGLVLFASWSGGFGTSAALGDVFAANGHPEITSIAFTSATVGMFVGVVGGIILARIGAARGHAKAFNAKSSGSSDGTFQGVASLPEHVRTGVLPDSERTEIGRNTFSGGSLESLSFHVGLVALLCLLGYWLKTWLDAAISAVSFPLFTITFLLGLLVRAIFSKLGWAKQIDKATINTINGSAADVLIVCGIVSIQPSFVADQLGSLLALFVAGLIFCLFLGLVLAPRLLGEDWFARQLFTWGWATGSVPTGIALLRIIDPDHESTTIEDFGYAYLPLIPVETAAVAVAPFMVLGGLSWAVAGIWGLIAIAGGAIAWWASRAEPTADASDAK